MLRDGVHRVVPNIADRNPLAACGFDIDIVHAGRGQGDELKFRQFRQHFRCKANLVDHGDFGAAQAAHEFLRPRGRVFLPVTAGNGFVSETDIHGERAAIQKHNAPHRAFPSSAVLKRLYTRFNPRAAFSTKLRR